MTDGSAWQRGGAPGGHPGQPYGQPTYATSAPAYGAPTPARPMSPYPPPASRPANPGTGYQLTPQPAPGTWWSDALSDPWRDPSAPVVVVRTPTPDAPELEKYEEPGKGRHSIGMVLVVSIVTALLAGALGGTLGYMFSTGANGPGGNANLGAAPSLAQRAPDSVAGLAKKVLPSVVTVRIRATGGSSLGSGFIASDDGYVITNQHVVGAGTGGAFVTFNNGDVAEARIVGSDPESDVAVLKIDQSGLPAAEFGDSDAVQVGDPVIAVGAPLGLSSTVTYGIVSAVDRPIRTNNNAGSPRYYAAIQTDAAVNQGNSGGPLFDAAGRVIGINSIIGSLAQDQESAGNVGLAFAIPINHAKRVASDIIDTGKARRTVIGATFDGTYRNIAGGARIQSIEPNGPAAAAGLKAGDVILKIGGRPIEEAADVVALVRKYAPGATVPVEYQRSGAKQQATVTVVADAK